MHRFQNLKQTPSLPLIPLRVQDAFSFKVDVIDEGVASLWCFRQAFKLLLHVASFGRRRFGQHLRQSSFQSGNKKFYLKIDGIDQKPAQLIHLNCILRLQKLGARVPGTRLYTTDTQKQRR